MMIANRKHDPNPTLAKKPTRFNLGGLIKKKITWKKSIDALASASNENHMKYTSNEKIPTFRLGTDSLGASPPAELTYPTGYTNFSHEPPLHRSSSLEFSEHLLSFPEDHYTSCRTECISLQNSEMTSALTFDENDQDSIGNSDLIFSLLPRLFEEEFIPYDAGLEEPAADYRSGGYHPVKLGDKYTSDLNRYKVVQKLGWGHFSTVWLCVSLMTGDFVAMKIVKLGATYSDAARDEINILKTLQGQDDDGFEYKLLESQSASIVHLLDNFQINGPNGTHIVMVFEVMGENLLHLIYNLRATKLSLNEMPEKASAALLPMPKVKLIVKQILHSINYMHQKGVIHTDIKPENILLVHNGDVLDIPHSACRASSKFQVLPSNPLKTNIDHLDNAQLNVKIADLGNATHSHLHFTNNIQTRQYRAPEVLLKYKSWGALADLWSIGCLTFELLTGDYLFEPKDGPTFSKDEDHLAQIIELIGEFPSCDYLACCQLSSAYFKDAQNMRNISSLKFWPLKNVLVEKYKFDPNDDDVNLVCDLISKCLRYNLNERFDCNSLLAHPWFRENAEYNKWECDYLPNYNHLINGFTREE